MLASFDVGVSQFIHKYDLRFSTEDCVNIHLLESNAFVHDRATGSMFKLSGQLGGLRSAVGLDNSHYDIFTALLATYRFAQHVVCFADSGGISEDQLEDAPGLFRRD